MRWLLLLVSGCAWVVPSVPEARVAKNGENPPLVIAALPVRCVACEPQQLAAMATEARMDLELLGYDIVDAELVNAEARTRVTVNDVTTVTGGRGWDPALMKSMGVEGVLIEEFKLFDPNVTVALTLERLDGSIVWKSECTALIDNPLATRLAIARASRCACASEALW